LNAIDDANDHRPQEERTAMIRQPLGLRLNPNRSVRDQIHEAARLGARGVVLDATGDLAPHRLGETGRRELRHLLRTVEVSLIALGLPTRRPFDTVDQLEDRIQRADKVFELAYELGTNLVLAQVGQVPDENERGRRDTFTTALSSLGHHADHRGVRLGIETGPDPGERLAAFLNSLNAMGLAVSIDPTALLRAGIDPVRTAEELNPWVIHAYAGDATDSPRVAASNPRGHGFPPGALDWEAYLGVLEEIGYRGFLTIWPEATTSPSDHFAAVSRRLKDLL
jgi:sugar phosphate isomerase/epimerase